MRKALTDKALDALKPQAKRYEVHDLYCPGLIVRRTLSKAFEGSVIRKKEFQRVDHAGFATAVRSKYRKAALLSEIESLGLEKSTKPFEGQRAKHMRISHELSPAGFDPRGFQPVLRWLSLLEQQHLRFALREERAP